MATTAQEEFDELMRDKSHRNHHPEDEDDIPLPAREMSTASVSMPRSSMSSNRDFIPRARYGANTGPKGVISDAQDFREQQRIHKLEARTSRVSLAHEGHTEPSGLTFGQQQQAERLGEAEENGNLSDEDELDDDFVTKWRQGRMQELQNGGRQGAPSHQQNGEVYGGVTSVDGQGYLDAVEGSGRDTTVVVYIYDDMSQVSQLFEKCLRTLSHKHENVCFVKLHFTDAEMEPAGVPAMIAYRGGEKFAALVPIIEEMPDDGDLDSLTLERVMQRHQILP